MIRDFFLGFIKIHILHHAVTRPVYGLALMEELRRHGYDLSPGTMYPVLQTMEQQGYLVHEKRLINGRIRKYYTITDAGRQALQEAKRAILELVEEVIEGQGPAHLPDPPSTYDHDVVEE